MSSAVSPSSLSCSSEGSERTTTNIRVVAPAALPAGYALELVVYGKPYTVTLPYAVKEGQEFELPYEPQDDEKDEIYPVLTSSTDDTAGDNKLDGEKAAWRHSIWGCCDVLTQATFWMACLCPPVLLAQIVSRLGLDYQGRTTSSRVEASLSYNRIILTWMSVLGVASYVGWMVFSMMFAAILLATVGVTVRKHLRSRYRMDERRPCVQKPFDCVTMFVCGPCALIQMARQTHDDKEYPGQCCTTNGLEWDAPDLEMNSSYQD